MIIYVILPYLHHYIIRTFHPGDVWVGAACWQTAECDWIPLQEDMISQLDVEYWREIWEKKTLNHLYNVHIIY